MWPRGEPGLALLITALGGWLWGSFLNLLVDRTPYRDGAPTGVHRDAPPGPPPGVSAWWPQRSLCFGCGRPIAWSDAIPIVSHLRLRGRCRACGTPFGRRMLAVEVLTPLAFAAWHGVWAAGGGSTALLLWGLAALSWLIVVGGVATERRIVRPALWLSAAALAAALLAGALVAGALGTLHW